MKRLTVLGLAAAAGITALVAPAFASGPIQIELGPSTHNWTASATGTINFDIWPGPDNVQCPVGTLAGTVNTGPSSSGLLVGSITSSTMGNSPTNSCKILGALDVDFTQVGTWDLNFDVTPKPTSAVTDDVTGYIDNIEWHVDSQIPGLCEFDLIGRVDFIFHETDTGGGVQDLEIDEQGVTGNLAADNVVGCLGTIANGDFVDMVGTYGVSGGLINVKP